MRALLIAKFRGDVDALTRAYDRAHQAIMQAGGAPGELRHHCAVGEDSLVRRRLGVRRGTAGSIRQRGNANSPHRSWVPSDE